MNTGLLLIVIGLALAGVLASIRLGRRTRIRSRIKKAVKTPAQAAAAQSILSEKGDVKRTRLVERIPLIGKNIVLRWRYAGLSLPVTVFPLGIVMAILALALIVPLYHLSIPMRAGVVTPAVVMFSMLWLKRKASARQFDILKAMAECIDALGRNIQIGQGIDQALKAVANEATGPIKGILEEINSVLAVGREYEVVFAEKAEDTGIEEFMDLAVVLGAKAKRGGEGAVESLNSLSSAIRSKVELREKIIAQSAQGKFTGYAFAALPIAVFIMVLTTKSVDLGVYFGSASGNMTLAGFILYDLLGLAMIIKMSNVD